MALFTFFFEYDGGTYISQVSAPTWKEAPLVWAEQFDLHEKPEYSDLFEGEIAARLVESVRFLEAAPLEGVLNAWCASSTAVDRPSLIHFVQTAES